MINSTRNLTKGWFELKILKQLFLFPILLFIFMSEKTPSNLNYYKLLFLSTLSALTFFGCANSSNSTGKSSQIPNFNQVETSNSNKLRLNIDQIAQVRKFLGEKKQDLLNFEKEKEPKAIGLVDLKDDGRFECNFLISTPLISGTKQENG